MKRVAVFGNTGGGKSTLARQLSVITGLPLYPLDKIQYRPGGKEVPHAEYLEIHANLLDQNEWIIDGFGCVESAWARFSIADTLVYVDLPLPLHYWLVTKRLIQGIVRTPEGWPEKSSVWKGSMNSYKVLPVCHRRLTPKYRQLVEESMSSKRVLHLKSLNSMDIFLNDVKLNQG